MARKWGEDGDEKVVLDYSQKDNEEAASEGKLELSRPMADLSLKSRVDDFEEEEEGRKALQSMLFTACAFLLHSLATLTSPGLVCSCRCRFSHTHMDNACMSAGLKGSSLNFQRFSKERSRCLN